MDQGAACNFMDIISAGQILTVSTEGNGMQRGGAKPRPCLVRDRDHQIPGGDTQILTFPRQAAAAYFPSGLKTKELSGRHGNVSSVEEVLKIFGLASGFAPSCHTSAPLHSRWPSSSQRH